MIRYLLLMLLTVPLMARGQTLTYWFDDQPAAEWQTVAVDGGSLRLEAEVGQLPPGLHTLHFQCVGSDGVAGAPVTRSFVKTVGHKVTGFYWFDDEQPADWQTIEGDGGIIHWEAEVGHLTAGLHTLHVQYVGSDGVTGIPATRTFVKTVGNGVSGRYWFDSDSTKTAISLKESAFLVDVSHLTDGLHTFHIEAIDAYGVSTSPTTATFVKMAQLQAIDSVICRSSVDGALWLEEPVAADNGELTWQMDVSGLPQGFHHLTVEVMMPGGMSAGSYSTWFLREPMATESADYVCMYTIDGDSLMRQAGRMADGTWHFDLDVAKLTDGLHRLTYYLNNERGVQTESQTAFFIKTPLGGTGMTGWQWWLNDLTDDIHTTTLQRPVDPLQVITTLDVGHQPLRTQSFHFEAPDGGQPAIYAKNQLHLRFSDVSQRSSEQVADFVDYEVSQPVTDIVELLSLPEHVFDRGSEGSISWYQLPMMQGDSLQLWSSVDCQIEAFTPQGDLLYQVSGAGSRQVGGFEALDTMTCYVALHEQQAGGTLYYRYSQWQTPQLTIEADSSSWQEGETHQLTIRRNRMNQVTIGLTLATSHPDRVILPDIVRIPAGHGSVTINVSTIDDERYQIPDSITFTVSAPRHDDGMLTLLLTDNDAPMDMAEWELLRQWHGKQGGSTWKQPWTFGDTPALTDSLAGVLMRNGHVMEVSLPDNNLSGDLQPHLFRLPAIEAINLSGNDIGGRADVQLAADMGQNITLRSLNIAHNRVGGNVGLLCQQLTALQKLDIGYNCFADVDPMLSPQLTTLYMGHQTISDTCRFSLGGMTAEEALAQLPSILLYNHAAQTYASAINLRFERPADNWSMTLAWLNGNLTVPYVSEQSTYYGTNGETLPVSVVDDANRPTGDTFPLTFNFYPGDTNFSGEADVVDLQTIINYIFNAYLYRPFNFTAANLNTSADETINVQDVVGMVNLLLHAEVGSDETAATARRSSRDTMTDATCRIVDGRLVIESDIPVAAFHVVVSSDVNCNVLPSGFTVSTYRTETGMHIVGYSLAGLTLPAGQNVIGRAATEDAAVTYVKLADADANEIEARTALNEGTGILDIDHPSMDTAPVYNLSGQRVEKPKEGLYIVGGKKTLYKKK